MNYQGGITQAYKVFREDLAVDKDFIEYKARGISLGVLVIGNYGHVLESVYLVKFTILNNFIDDLLFEVDD